MKIQMVLIALLFLVGGCYESSDNPLPVEATNYREYREAYIIGDSISIYNMAHLIYMMADYEILHNPGNAMTSRWILQNLDTWIEGHRPDIIIINCGLWDVKRTESSNWEVPVPIEEYEANLRNIVGIMKSYQWGLKIIWVRTTPVIEERQKNRLNADIDRYNEIADTVMEENNIQVINPAFAISPETDALISPDGVHFTEKGCIMISNLIADAVIAHDHIPEGR